MDSVKYDAETGTFRCPLSGYFSKKLVAEDCRRPGSGQSENIDCIVTARRFDVGDLGREFGHLRVIAGHDRDELFSIHAISDGADRHISAENRFPQFLSCFGVERGSGDSCRHERRDSRRSPASLRYRVRGQRRTAEFRLWKR